MRRAIALGLSAMLIAGIAVALTLVWSWRQLNTALVLPEEGIFFEVRSGTGLATVTAELERLGVIRHSWILNAYASAEGSARRIQAGEYQLLPGLSSLDLLAKLGRGDVYLHRFTVIEGWRTAELIRRLRAHPAIAAGTLSAAEIMDELGKPDVHPEGQFLPDTYSFPRGMRDVEFLALAHEALETVLDEAWAERTDTVLRSPYEGLILASIIEKETALASERGLISGVFHERLKRGMRLQTDPTVIYGLGDAYDGNLTSANLAADTPYNTYTRRGLPPSPIALAGRAAIVAAFSPVETAALYFVATGEPDGSHAFSATLEEHNAAVARYLARQRAGN